MKFKFHISLSLLVLLGAIALSISSCSSDTSERSVPDLGMDPVQPDTSLAIREGTEVTAQGQQATAGRTIKVLAGKVAAEIIPGGSIATQFETPTGVAAVKGTVLVIEVGGEVE